MEPDNRVLSYAELEEIIQNSATNKDPNFKLSGSWKTYKGIYSNFNVYSVDGNWIRKNLSIMFGNGGHGFVHEFIPLDEIWIDIKHYEESGIENLPKDMIMSDDFTKSTILHEIIESILMRFGINFWKAHNFALDAERLAGILKDPHSEN
jgi:hypothetical protein